MTKLNPIITGITVAIYLITPWEMNKFESICFLGVLYANLYELWKITSDDLKRMKAHRKETRRYDYELVGFSPDDPFQETYLVEGSRQR